jgi:hypothetical protein
MTHDRELWAFAMALLPGVPADGAGFISERMNALGRAGK